MVPFYNTIIEMKIFIISRGIPETDDPQWGNFELDQAKALSQKGHQVIMLSVDGRLRLKKRKLGISKYTIEHIPVYSLYLFPVSPFRIFGKRMPRIISSFLILQLYKRVLKEEKAPDILYAHYFSNIIGATKIGGKYHIPTIGLEHWSKMGKCDIPSDLLKDAILYYPKVDQLLTVSEALRLNIKEKTGVDSIVVNNIVDSIFSYRPPSLPKANKESISIVTVGSILPIKGYDILIEALAIVRNTNTNWNLTIVGEGTDRKHIEELISSLSMNEFVTLAGRKNREAIVEILRDSDLYVLSSYSETFGLAAVEALACGLPLVCTDCGGPRDFVQESNGVVCKVGDARDMAAKILYMLEHIHDYDNAGIAKDCSNRFSPQVIADKLDTILENTIRKND